MELILSMFVWKIRNCGNILKLTVNIKDLDKFKEDILSVSDKFNIKNIWESEESTELKTKEIIN